MLLSLEEVAKWKQRINRSLEWRRQEYEEDWERYQRYYEGEFDETLEVTVNMVYANTRVIIPSIYSKNPDINIVMRNPDYPRKFAEAMQDLISYHLVELDVKREVKKCILDSILTGNAFYKMGFQGRSWVEQDTEQDTKSLIDKFIEGTKRLVGAYRNKERDNKTYCYSPDERIQLNRPWGARLSPWEVVVPRNLIQLEAAPWITHSFVRAVKDVKDNKNYRNTEDIGPSDVTKVKDLSNRDSNMDIDTDEEEVILHEVYDLRENMIYTLSESADHCLQAKKNPFVFLDSRHTLLHLGFNEVPNKFYCMSDIASWEDQQHELNALRSQMVRHRKRYNRKYLAKKGAIGEEEKAKLERGEDGLVIETDEESLENTLQAIEDAPLPPEIYQVEARIKGDIDDIMGVTSYQRGSTQGGVKTATEAAIVENRSQSRLDERVDIISDFARRISINLAQMIHAFMRPEDVAPIIGKEAAKFLMNLEIEQIRREFAYNIIYGSSMMINKDVQRQQDLALYQLVANDPAFDILTPRLEILRAHGKKRPEDWLSQAMIPVLQQRRILDAMNVPIEGSEEGMPGGNQVEPGVPSEGSIKSGMKRSGPKIPGGKGGTALVR